VLLFGFALGQSGSLFAQPRATARKAAPVARPVTSKPAKSAPRTVAASTQPVSSSRSQTVAAPAANPAVPAAAALDGGDVSLDFVAAGPFTYNHATGLGSPPQFGYDNRTISKTNGVVESLEAGDFRCGDLVTFFTQIVIDGGASAGGTIEIDYSFGAETTGQPGLGFDNIVGVAVNSSDGGNVGLDGNETATLSNEHLDTQGYDEVKGTVTVTNLDPGEHAIVRVIVHLACLVGGSPTGNILNQIEAARVTNPEDTISVGQQTVPMKKVEDVAQPGLDVNKSCPDSAAVGEQITYTIEIVNTGNEALNIQSVIDTVDGHAGANITGSFPASVAANSSVSATYKYTVLANDPDPLSNSVAVTVEGAVSEATLHGSASCDTDITHQPGISVTKTCPESVPAGDDVTYTITVTNTGNEGLEQLSVIDTLLGDITDEFSPSLAQGLGVGDSATAVVSYSPAPGQDPVENSVTATGLGADSEAKATDTATCSTDVLAPAIQIVKDGPALVHRGDTITYTFEVTNPGEVELFDVALSDPICDPGTITPGTDVDGSLAVGEVWHFTCTHLVTDADPDPIPNTVTVRGDTHQGEGGQEVTDTDDHVVDIIHPGIAVVKTVDRDTVPVGTTVTYTYVVTNIGDTTLYDVSVDDDVMGHIGDIAILEPGASVTLTKDFVVGDQPVTNVATVSGNDILGRSVSATDDASVAPIAGSTPTPPPTPFTGSEAGRLGLISIALFGIGVTVVAATRRRRAERDAA
jgi:uncharacterized repeat protein (TIGR01451 family)